MAYAEDGAGLSRGLGDDRVALAAEWRRLTRGATFVALLTSPAFFLVLWKTDHWNVGLAALGALAAVIAFRGFTEVVVRKFIPSPTLYGADDAERHEHIIARRRAWYWRKKAIRLPFYAALGGIGVGIYFIVAGFNLPPIVLLFQLVQIVFQLPLLFIANFLIFFGPIVFFAIRQIRAYEPGDADWGVRVDDVRGQAEAKEEVTRIISLWQSGEAFEKAGGKRERGLLFLGAPGTGKTMLSKAIATGFNCPFVTIPGSGFGGMFIGMDALTVQWLAFKAKRMARKWGGQCIVFIDEIDAVGMRRAALGAAGMEPAASGLEPGSIHDHLFFGPNGALNPSGDMVLESRAWREKVFAQRAERPVPRFAQFMARVEAGANRFVPGAFGGNFGGSMALNQLLVVMDGIDDPPLLRKWFTNRFNTFLDAMFIVPQSVGGVPLRLRKPPPRKEQIYFIGACNVPIEQLDPALIRPGRMGRHVWFRTPTKDDRLDILDLYIDKVSHVGDLDLPTRRDELARMMNGYSPAMIEQVCSMALTYAHSEGRRSFARADIVEAMTTVESGTAVGIEYIPEETRAVAIHEAGHAAASHVYMKDSQSTRLSIRMRGSSLGHHQAIEKEERFSSWRHEEVARLIWALGAMAAEHVFYGENGIGVGGDVFSATRQAARMVGLCGMGPSPVDLTGRVPDAVREEEEARVMERFEKVGMRIMNRAGGGSMLAPDPLGMVLADRGKRTAAAQILGQAYIAAFCLVEHNRDAVARIADTLVERREMHGDEVVELLEEVGLEAPEIDVLDDRIWPRL